MTIMLAPKSCTRSSPEIQITPAWPPQTVTNNYLIGSGIGEWGENLFTGPRYAKVGYSVRIFGSGSRLASTRVDFLPPFLPGPAPVYPTPWSPALSPNSQTLVIDGHGAPHSGFPDQFAPGNWFPFDQTFTGTSDSSGATTFTGPDAYLNPSVSLWELFYSLEAVLALLTEGGGMTIIYTWTLLSMPHGPCHARTASCIHIP
jgi:hypothetical protein